MYCTNSCNPEGSTLGPNKNLFITFGSPRGKIFQVTSDGKASLYATLPASDYDLGLLNGTGLRLAFDKSGNLYTFFIQKNLLGKPTANFGLWKIPPGGGVCELQSGPCKKIWPAPGETLYPNLRFGDGIALDNYGYVYIADSQMGNIWKVDLKDQSATLWAGHDSNSPTDVLTGNPNNFILGFAPGIFGGRGLGVISLALSDDNKHLYATNYDYGRVIDIPINTDGTPGTAKILVDLSKTDMQLDALFLDKNTNSLYATRIKQNMIGLVSFLGNVSLLLTLFLLAILITRLILRMKFISILTTLFLILIGYSIIGALLGWQLLPTSLKDGHAILSANLQNPTDFNILIDDPMLGTTSSVVADGNNNFYINVYSSDTDSGARIIKATKQ